MVSVQFQATLNIFIGGRKIFSRNAMTEFFHNLSMQALNEEDKSVDTSFVYIGELCHNIKELLQSNRALVSNKEPYTFMEYLAPQFEKIQDRNQKFEENVVCNKLSGMPVAYTLDTSYMTFPNIPQEIEEQAREKEEAQKRLPMSTYGDELLEVSELSTRKELLGVMANVRSDIAVDVVSNLSESGTSNKKAKEDIKSTIKQGSVNILSRVDEAQTVKSKVEETIGEETITCLL